MADPTSPPRPSLRPSVKTYIAGCVWNSGAGRVETTGGTPVSGWLNETGNPGITTTVQWEAGTATDVGDAVPGAIPQESFDIIKNGSLDQQTGLVTHKGLTYRFQFKAVSGVAQMAAYPV